MNHVKSRASRLRDLPDAEQPGEAVCRGGSPDELRAELIAFRRDLHMHPELGNQEFRTTAAIKDRLEKAGLAPRVLRVGTGLMCDVGEWDGVTPMLALRADIDALPIPDTKTGVPYRSTVPDRAHACGHDVHTTTVLGAGLVLAELDRQGRLPNAVRLIFQPRRSCPAARSTRSSPGCWRASGASSASTATRRWTPGGSGCASGPSPRPATAWRSPSTAPAATPPGRT